MTRRSRGATAVTVVLALGLAAPALGGFGPQGAAEDGLGDLRPWVLRAAALAAQPDAVEALSLHAAWDRGDPAFRLVPPPVRPDPLVDEVRAVLAELGAAETPEVAALASVPPPQAEALAALVRAHRDAAALTQQAFAAGPRPDPVRLAEAKALLAREALAALPLLRPLDHPGLDACGTVLLALDDAPDEHLCEYAFAVDLGGDDVWRNNAGGNRPGADLCATPGSLSQGFPPTTAFALDAAGNDRYLGIVRNAGVAGGACNGLGALVDAAGGDVYDTVVLENGGANGGANFGAGLLLDLAGDDRYHGAVVQVGGADGGSGGVNGGANFGGHGDLLDLGGADVRGGSVDLEGGLNGGENDGSGFLFDCGPEGDAYDGRVAKGAGINGGSSLGRGLLVECGGDDAYDGTIGTSGSGTGNTAPHGGINGGAYTESQGLLVDLGGDDTYHGTIWGSGGVNGAAGDGAGGLVDLGGDDAYVGDVKGHGAVNGAAGRAGVAVLWDAGGDDRYLGLVGGTGGVNGAASGGAALLLDGGGDDAYEGLVLGLRCDSVPELPLCGGFANGGGHLGAGWLVDAGGRDTYREGALAESDNSLVRGAGGRLDGPLGSPPA